MGEVYTERKEQGYDSLQILSVSIHHGISNEELDSNILGKKVRRSEDKSLYKHVYFGDLVLNMMRAWQGAIGVVKSEGMVSPAYITATPNAQLYPLFMDYCLRRDEMIIQMDNLSYGVTDFRKRLYWDSFINILCRIPSVPEQEKITVFFAHLDNTIALLQRKIDKLKQLKQGFLQQMFPQNGENVPRLRFANFEDKWEQCKLKELITLVVREVPKPDKPYKRISVRSHAKGTFHQNVDDPKTISMENLYLVRENDLIVNITFAWEHAIAVATKQDDGLLVSHRFPTFFIDKSDINFIYYSVSQEKFRRKMELISPGGAGRNRVLNKADFVKIKIEVPVQFEEQTKIGLLIKQLDNNIVLQQTKLDKLQLLKSGYLQKIFI